MKVFSIEKNKEMEAPSAGHRGPQINEQLEGQEASSAGL